MTQAKRCTFDQWIKQLFDHDAHDFESYSASQDKMYWCDISDSREVAYITQAFENAETVFAPFSNAQLNQGLWYLVSHSSEIMFVLSPLMGRRVTWRERERCIHSFYDVYEQVFAKRCSSELCHLGKPSDNVLNGICYMWWDVFPFWGNLKSKSKIDAMFLDVMVETLKIDSEACREGALHGLGHFPHRDGIEEIIDRFLVETPQISPALREYALRAQYEGVL